MSSAEKGTHRKMHIDHISPGRPTCSQVSHCYGKGAFIFQIAWLSQTTIIEAKWFKYKGFLELPHLDLISIYSALWPKYIYYDCLGVIGNHSVIGINCLKLSRKWLEILGMWSFFYVQYLAHIDCSLCPRECFLRVLYHFYSYETHQK